MEINGLLTSALECAVTGFFAALFFIIFDVLITPSDDCKVVGGDD
ncbi:TMhelix containing protein [Vibrio phage 1.238.A._10N.261.52.F10]|uniref:TMhelix containing protein n=2 Tax=Pariacacavirus TaxID=2948856 RepID=A0A2I7RUD9_9CAUD|nr:TMhelix containing protein [Vibrio phage 1.238.A._10N.261.52.F10]YP_010093465.1 TMhelix containing protein [Vibrio phage 1.245.O._10N.261.54.C7]AUR97268.1 TMhelix containing protein [Vibrio phage 1.238.A._10N.261.52.F10]AUR97362.1 TMhelix containing protein [Vibrio phage 1.238.B._10N.261.52.F10]AUR97935.1 TMhelix containing protein [Vibrio phage 1.245.O._10N.261.54.C7]